MRSLATAKSRSAPLVCRLNSWTFFRISRTSGPWAAVGARRRCSASPLQRPSYSASLSERLAQRFAGLTTAGRFAEAHTFKLRATPQFRRGKPRFQPQGFAPGSRHRMASRDAKHRAGKSPGPGPNRQCVRKDEIWAKSGTRGNESSARPSLQLVRRCRRSLIASDAIRSEFEMRVCGSCPAPHSE
jgi:hypothetical protein